MNTAMNEYEGNKRENRIKIKQQEIKSYETEQKWNEMKEEEEEEKAVALALPAFDAP